MRLLLGFLIAASLAVPGVAAANDGPMPVMVSIVQVGQDVEITFGLPRANSLAKLTREHGYEVIVLSERVYAEQEAVGTTTYCYDPPHSIPCDEHPEQCLDCDGDGINECDVDECDVRFNFMERDECVGYGHYKYTIDSTDWLSIVVLDTGDACLDTDDTDTATPDGGSGGDADADSDSGSDGDADSDIDSDDDSSDSCSVTSVGRAAAPHVLALVMLAIGLVAARVGGKR